MDKFVYLRIISFESKKDEFMKALFQAKKLKIGNGMVKDVDLGPLTTEKRLNEIEDL